MLVERLVSGLEVAVEGLLVDGELHVLAMFDKPDETVGLTFAETLLIQPARLDRGVRSRVIDVVARAAAAIGLVNGPIHAECIIDGDRVWFLELAPGPSADCAAGPCGSRARASRRWSSDWPSGVPCDPSRQWTPAGC